MNSVNNLTKKYIKASKIRNMLIIITIILTTCLLTSIGILSYSLQKMFLKQVADQTGTAHGRYSFIDSKTYEDIKRHNKIESAGEWIELGVANHSKLENTSLILSYGDEQYASMCNIKLLEGNLPKGSNEIAVEKWVLEKLNLQQKLGQKINLKYSQSDKKLKGERIYHEGEFILSGIIKDNEYTKELRSSEALVSKAYIEKNVSTENIDRNVYVRIKNSSSISEDINEIGNSFNLSENQISTNKRYIEALGGDITALIPFIIIGLVVMIAASIVIYNIFYISIAQRINQFGLLSAIGATKKQLRKIVVREGLRLALIGIPLGIILGHIVSYSIFPLIELNAEINISSSIYIILISAAVSLITLIISIRKPSKVASKISPVESIRYTGAQSNMKKLERKSSGKLNLKKIAHLSFWRNKKRTVLTILSLTMSGMLFIIFASVLSSMNMDNLTRDYVSSDFQLTSSNLNYVDEGTDPLNEGLIKKISSIEGVKDVSLLKFHTVFTGGKNLPTEYVQQGMTKLNSDLFGFDSSLLEGLKQYVTEGEFSIDDLKNNNYMFIEDKENNSQYKVGDKVKLEYNIDKDTAVEKEFIVKGKVSKNPNWLGWSNIGPTFITHEETFTREFKDARIGRINVNFKKDKAEKLEKALKALVANNDEIKYDSYRELKAKNDSAQKGLAAVAYSLLGIIALIGVMNVINTMITSILSRKKEFGLLQAVGLTNKQLTKMLQIEGLYYAVISGITAIVLGTTLGNVFFQLFKKSATYAVYKFPIAPILMVVFIFIFLQILITYLVKNKLNKESIVDRIRHNE